MGFQASGQMLLSRPWPGACPCSILFHKTRKDNFHSLPDHQLEADLDRFRTIMLKLRIISLGSNTLAQST